MLNKLKTINNLQQNSTNPGIEATEGMHSDSKEKEIIIDHNAEPSIEKIKVDLIGQRISGWEFSYLEEFKQSEILNKKIGENGIEYHVKFNLMCNSSKNEHITELLITYNKSNLGWQISKIDTLSFS